MHRMTATRLRIYPTPEQAQAFAQIAGCCRLVYNAALEQRRDFWRQYRATQGRHIHWMGQKRELPALKDAFPFLAEAPAHCLQMALQDLQRAYDAFFAGRAGYPRPRRKLENDAFRFPDPAQIRLEPGAGLLRLPKFGRSPGDHGPLRVRVHRPIRGWIRSVTVIREGAVWYASVLTRVRCRPVSRVTATAQEALGVDRGTVNPFAGSDGVVRGAAVAPAPGSGAAKRRRRLEQALARAKKGSRRRAKVRLKLAAHRAREARRRRDLIEKVTTEIAKSHRVVVIEDLRVQAMTASARGTAEEPGRNVAQKAGLNRSILDKGWGMFVTRLEQKLAAVGGQLIRVPAAFSSQTCSGCGHVAAESRVTRDRFRCVECGSEQDADLNAALVIRGRGLARLGLAP